MKRVIFGLRVAVVCAFAMASASCGDNTGNASCGNGILEPGEECDTSIPQGHNGACPDVAACNDLNPCTEDSVVGGGTCQAKCAHKPITAVIPNDGCCVSNDPMLEPECMGCGDGVVDPMHGEICDTGIPAGMPGHCPTAADCPSTQCKQLMGSACMAQCIDITTPSGATMDGCCPPGANNDPADTAHYDSDCNSNCGNGILENGERCDTGIAAGQPGACPQNIADCGAAQVCVRQQIQGTNCQAHCVATNITTCSANTADNCCPSGCMRSTDIDCPATCGDGVVESNETCDPSAAGSVCQTAADCAAIVAADTSGCTHSTLTGSAANCTAQCSTTHTTTTSSTADGCCPPGGNANNDPDCQPICGNGVVESGELCDTTIPSNISGHCPSSAECTAMSQGTCPSVARTGSGCTAQCSATYPAANATTRDSCCPPGNNNNTDIDCAAVCGNGVVESRAGELCDTAITSGNGKCPTNAATDCNDSIACTTDTITGSGCTAQCVHTAITACINGDGCCAPGCIHSNDTDCPLGCGDGVFPEGTKTCDPAIPSGTGHCPTASECSAMTTDPCNPFVLTGSATQCTARCVQQAVTTPICGDRCCLRPTENISTCAADCPAACGDGIITSPETCDGTFVAGNAHFTIPGGGSSSGTTCAGNATDCAAIRDNAGNAGAFPDGPSDKSVCYPNNRIAYSGDATPDCSANCTFGEVTPSGNTSDNCCPTHNGATGGTNIAGGADIDCAVCGNNTIDLGETCDGAFNAARAFYTPPAGGTGPGCVATNNCTCAAALADCNAIASNAANAADFPDGAACYTGNNAATFSGSACNFNCSYVEHGPSGAVSDGCCPASIGGDETNDIDCAPGCGNSKFANGSLAAGSGDSPCSSNTDCGGGQFCINSTCHREACDTGIAFPAPGHCPTFLECRVNTTNACTPIAKTGTACTQMCINEPAITTPGAGEVDCVAGAPASVDPQCGQPGHPSCCMAPPVACNPNPATCSTNFPSCGGNCCCGANPLPVCCTKVDGCCPNPSASFPAGGLDSFLFDVTCIDGLNGLVPNNVPPSQTNCTIPNATASNCGNSALGQLPCCCATSSCGGAGQLPCCCGATGQARCCSPVTVAGGDPDCYCGDGTPAAAPAGLHAEACHEPVGEHNSYDGCTDSCTPSVACSSANGCTPNGPCSGAPPGTGAGCGTGTPTVGAPCLGGSGIFPGIDNSYCKTNTGSGLICATERVDPRFQGGYCTTGCTNGQCASGAGSLCQTNAPGSDPCAALGAGSAGNVCVNSGTNSFACVQGCATEFDCRYNEGFHCVALPGGFLTPFCNSNSPAGCVNPNGCLPPSLDPGCGTPGHPACCSCASPNPGDPGGDAACGTGGHPPCCCICKGCASVCGDGLVQSAAGEQCDNGATFLDAGNGHVPNNYVASGLQAGCSTDGTTCVSQGTDPACGQPGHSACCCSTGGCIAGGVNPDRAFPTTPTNCSSTTSDPSCGTAGHLPCCCGNTGYAPCCTTPCTTSCTAKTGWIGDPCIVGQEAATCPTLVGQPGVGLSRTHCLAFDPNMTPSLTGNDPKFRTRYDKYVDGTGAPIGEGGFMQNGYCSADCSLTAQDCPTLPVGGGVTFRGVCVPGQGQDPTAGRGVCVFGCLSNTQCRFKEGYRCWPIADLLGLGSTFLSEGPRACINPGSPTSDFQGP